MNIVTTIRSESDPWKDLDKNDLASICIASGSNRVSVEYDDPEGTVVSDEDGRAHRVANAKIMGESPRSYSMTFAPKGPENPLG